MIIGRQKELEVLQNLYVSKEPQFLAIYGRRRIGKTYLVSEFFQGKGLYFEITGMKNGSTTEQLLLFAYKLSNQFSDGEKISPPKNWGEAFHMLQNALEKTDSKKRIILFFDEVPWLASPKSRFINFLEHFWNSYLSKKKSIILVICGSAASWIIKNIINNRGGLHGRVTKQIRLQPFTLTETEEYLKSRHIELDRKQIIEIYMAIGGVPKYLSYIERGKSATQIINDLCFAPQGALIGEFNNLYSSLFDHHGHHVAVIKTLAKIRQGMTKEELLKKTKLTSGGTSSKIIQELIDSSFISYSPFFGKKKASGIYRLIDEYSLFYLTWIEKAPHIVDEQYWTKKSKTPQWLAWSGFAFESLCLKHVQKIKEALGISGVGTVDSSWQFIPKKGEDDEGAQIDLVIDREDRTINLCEIKYCDAEYVVDKSYEKQLRGKKQIFREKTKTKKTLFVTMITTFGVKPNASSTSIIDMQVNMNKLF